MKHDKYYKLAQFIKLAGKEISKDHINKFYDVSHKLGVNNTGKCKPLGLEVTDDSGYRSITVGDVYTDKGYAYIYTDNADEDGKFMYSCFPPVELIAERLKAIAESKTFYIKGDKAYTEDVGAYDSWGVMRIDRKDSRESKKAITFLAETVEMFADKIDSDPRSAQEIFEIRR